MYGSTLLSIGCGAVLGAWSRFGLSYLMQPMLRSFPAGTLTVNLLGSFIIGILFFHADANYSPLHPFRFFLITGFLGSFTTFSGFSVESFSLLRDREMIIWLAHIALHVFGSIGMTALGYLLSRQLEV